MNSTRAWDPESDAIPAWVSSLGIAATIALLFGTLPIRPAPFWIMMYALAVVVRFIPFALSQGTQAKTELLILLGVSRRDLEWRYVGGMLLTSTVHTAGWLGAWIIAGRPSLPTLGLAGPAVGLQVAVSMFAAQVLVRSTALMAYNACMATALPGAVRSLFTLSRLRWSAPIPYLLTALLLAAPAALALSVGTPLILALPAALAFVAFREIVRSVEFSGDWGATFAPRPVKPPLAGSTEQVREATPSVRPKANWSQVRSLLWSGLSRWVKVLVTSVITIAGLVYVLVNLAWLGGSLPADKVIAVAGSVLFLPLLLTGHYAFTWSSIGPQSEMLHLAGVPVSTLRRLKLIAGATIVLVMAVFGILCFLRLARPETWATTLEGFSRAPLSYFLLAGAGHLLLSMNESPVCILRGRQYRGVDLMAARGLLFVPLALGGLFSLERVAFPWMSLFGLSVLAIAIALWTVGWLRSGDEQACRGDAFGLDRSA